MGIFSKLARSADLASGMMERLGSRLPDEILAHPDTGARTYAGVVMRCAGCAEQDHCAALQAGCDHLDAAPDYCRNKTLLDRSRA